MKGREGYFIDPILLLQGYFIETTLIDNIDESFLYSTLLNITFQCLYLPTVSISSCLCWGSALEDIIHAPICYKEVPVQ